MHYSTRTQFLAPADDERTIPNCLNNLPNIFISRHTRRAYERIGRRFLDALAADGKPLRRATVDDVQRALEAMRIKGDGSASSAATVNTYVAAVKALLCLPIRWASPASMRRR